MSFQIVNDEIRFVRAGEIVRISACGKNCIRFQASPSGKLLDQDWTLLPGKAEARVWEEENRAVLETGSMRAELYRNGKTVYYREGRKLLEEKSELTFDAGFRNYRNKASDLWSARITFEANEEEHFYGLGHEANNCFDMKGCTVDLRHLNAKCAIPFVYSSLGYGFLWNQPSTGRCELARNRTRWTSDSTRQVDYVVMGGGPKEVAGLLADLTGHAPQMPEWATGFWQCKLRYETQDQLLEVARKYKELGIPLSVIVIDYFHWTEQGDYKFDPKYWPDPKKMTEELHDMGVKLMVSMWPTINEHSENYRHMLENNMLIRTVSGSNRVFDFYGPQAEIDPTNPETRAYVWKRLKENYIDNGVDCLWFDEAEPEIHPEHFDNLILSIGNGSEVGLLYPYYYAQLVYDGMKEMGRDDIVTLSRCAYLGAQKFGSLVWSGDIPSTFQSLKAQIQSGLNMSVCGIPWWTTDIGGFHGARTDDPDFHRLYIRWFEYGCFCPVMRLHGNRNPQEGYGAEQIGSGSDNEIWSFSDEAYEISKKYIFLRERLRDYIRVQMKKAHEDGTPVMRPVFYDFPTDPESWNVEDAYLFGPDLYVAPVMEDHVTERKVYLPAGTAWFNAWTGEKYEGGQKVTVAAPMDTIPVFVKEGADTEHLLNIFSE